MTELDIKMAQAMEARSHIETAKAKAIQLDAVLHYMRSDHVGMVRGDGDLTRYISYLSRKIHESINRAAFLMEAANIPEDLPF